MSRTRATPAVPSRRPGRLRLAAVLALAPLLAACAAGQEAQTRLVRSGIDGTNTTVGDLVVRLAHIDIDDPVEAEEGTVYLSVYNAGSTADELLSVSSPAGEVEISEAAGVELPPLTRTDLLSAETTGGREAEATITLTATEALRRATTVPLTLNFARAGALEIVVPVQVPEERPEVGEEYLNVIERAAEEEGEE